MTRFRQKDGFAGESSVIMPRMVTELMASDPVMSALYVTDIGYYPLARGHYRHRPEGIEQYVLIYCVDGRGSYQIEGHDYDVAPNMFFVLPAGIPHTYSADPDNSWTIYWIHFNGTLAAHLAADLTTPQSVRPSMNSRISNRIKLFNEIINTLNGGLDVDSLRYACTVLHHFLGTLCHLRQYRAASGESETDITDAVIHYIDENMERKITLSELAGFTGYSVSHLSALFRLKTGYSPMEYAAILKAKAACEYLDNSDLHVSQICHRVGFDDPYYFSRFFTKMMGVSPLNYRNRQGPI